MVEALGRQYLSITSEHHLQCAGHIINLVVKAILYSDRISKFNRRIFELWRKFGAI